MSFCLIDVGKGLTPQAALCPSFRVHTCRSEIRANKRGGLVKGGVLEDPLHSSIYKPTIMTRQRELLR